jgi:hypothetical protein
MSTAADLLKNAKPTGHRLISLYCRPANNLGATTFTTSIDVGTFLNQSLVGNDPAAGAVTQRPLSVGHATSMAAFNLSALINSTASLYEAKFGELPQEVVEVFDHVSRKSYYAWAPLVGSVRFALSEVLAAKNETSGEWMLQLRPDQLIWVVDGQHRRKGLEYTRDWLTKMTTERKYPTLKAAFPPGLKAVGNDALVFWQLALEEFTCSFSITAELHFGMTLDQERQLFYFLNDLSRAVPSAVSQAFDQDNAINVFTHELIKDFIPMGLVSEKGQVDWEDPAWIRRDSINAVNAKLILNHGNIENAKSSVVGPRLEDARAFWKAVLALPGIYDRKASLAAQPAMLKAIAKCYYDLKWARGSGRKNLPADIAETFLAALPSVDFSPSNTLWRTMSGKPMGVLHSDGSFRFAPTHNEIVPLLSAELRKLTATI